MVGVEFGDLETEKTGLGSDAANLGNQVLADDAARRRRADPRGIDRIDGVEIERHAEAGGPVLGDFYLFVSLFYALPSQKLPTPYAASPWDKQQKC